MDSELRKIVDSERKRNRAGAARRRARLQAARREARRLARRFREEDPGLRRIILFGSVASGRVRSESFDIDLAVEAEEYLRLVAVAEKSSFSVDVVDLQSVSQGFRDRIEASGVLLHES